MKVTSSSNFSSVKVWVAVVIFRLRVTAEYCRELLILLTIVMISQILSGMKKYLIIKSQWIMVEIKCRRSWDFFYRMIRKISMINRFRRWGRFLVSNWMSGSCIWVNIKWSFNTRRRSQWKWAIRKRGWKIFRSKWFRLYVRTQKCRDRTWCWCCTWGRRCFCRSWSQIIRMSYRLRRGGGWIFLFTIHNIINRRGRV